MLFKITVGVRVSSSYSVENHRGGGLGRGLAPFPRKNVIIIITTYYFCISHFNAHPQCLGPTLKLFF